MNLDYKLATFDELDNICSLVKEAIIEMEIHGIYQWDELYPTRDDFKCDIDNKNLFTVYDGQVLAAFYVINDVSDEQYKNGSWICDDKSAYILHRFCVSPRMQNKGLGKAILTHIENHVRDLGYHSIRLDTFTENPFAQNLYRHNGYESRGYVTWRKGQFDLMEKKL